MPDTTTTTTPPAGGTTTTTTDTTTTPPAGAPPAAPPAGGNASTPISMTSEQLKNRLDETRTAAETKLLKSLGFDKTTDAAEFLKKAKELQQSQLTEQEKLQNSVKELEPKAKRADALEQQLTALVDEQFAALPEAARTAIDTVANGNAEKRLEMMRVMRASGLLGAAPPAPAAPAGPATSAPPANPPTPAGSRTKFDEWQDLEKDPNKRVISSIFYNSHKAEIERARPAT